MKSLLKISPLGVALLALLIVFSPLLHSQTPPNNPTLTGSAVYSNYDWTGTLTIAAGANIVFNNPVWQQGATLTVNSGGTLTITTSIQAAGPSNVYGTLQCKADYVQSQGSLNVETGGIFITNQLELNGTNTFYGNTRVTTSTQIHNGLNLFSNCGSLVTADLINNNDYTVGGNGLIHITANYNNEASEPGYIGHPLAISSTIYIWYVANGQSSSGSFGNATVSATNNSPCAAVLPVKFSSFTLKGNYK